MSPVSPDHDYYRQVARRIDHNRACLSVARKLCRRAYHILRELGDEALAPLESGAPSPPLAVAACTSEGTGSASTAAWM